MYLQKTKAMDFLEKHDGRQSFLMMLSTPACHAPFTPKPEYSHRYSNTSAPRTPNFFKYPGEVGVFSSNLPYNSEERNNSTNLIRITLQESGLK